MLNEEPSVAVEKLKKESGFFHRGKIFYFSIDEGLENRVCPKRDGNNDVLHDDKASRNCSVARGAGCFCGM